METILAAAHFLLIIATVALVLAEFVLLRLDATAQTVGLLSRIDLLYGVFALLVVVSGLLRVFLGDVPAAQWGANHAFWTKMALFGVIGGLSVPPTLRYRKWHKALAVGSLPDRDECRKAARFVHGQLGLYVFLPILAVLMAASAEA